MIKYRAPFKTNQHLPVRTTIIKWLLIFLSFSASAQTPAGSELPGIMSSIKNTTASLPIEKLYFQLDKPWYAAGDTIWFKAYLFDATFLSASSLSGVLYVELTSDSNKLFKRLMLPVSMGVSWGNIALDEKEYHQAVIP